MSNNKLRVDICIATFHRPQGLADLLKSLSIIDISHNDIRIIVIDNDINASSKKIIDQFKKIFHFDVTYYVEAERGISYARNAALFYSDSDFIAFIDDDEIADRDWLLNLTKTMVQFNADVVFGPVKSVISSDAPKWVHSYFSNHKLIPTGVKLEHGATSNVLIRTSKVQELGIRFDEAYALTGGEDTDFFYRMSQAGAKLVWCNEAIVYEEVPTYRQKLRWVLGRSFRSGQCVARIFYKNKGFIVNFNRAFRKLAILHIGIIELPIRVVLDYSTSISVISRIASAIGELSVIIGFEIYYKEYINKDYTQSKNYEEYKKLNVK